MWRELRLLSSDGLDDVTVFTTAELRWQPLVASDPNGAQIATLWGDPGGGVFGAVVRSADDIYTLIRNSD